MSTIRRHLKVGLDRARVSRYNHKVSSDALKVRQAQENVERAKLGGISYI
jgi:hypothetical protein